METIIKWQTGTPKHDGYYIVTALLSDETPYVLPLFRAGFHWFTNEGKRIADQEFVVAWCRLRDIKPYKEEKK